jgi:flagellar motor switch protein FliN/FliY
VVVQNVDFPELQSAPGEPGNAPLSSLLDVTVTVTAELGRVRLSIAELLKLNVGSVMELDRLVAEPVDLMVQDVRLARGEVVVVEDHFAIRIKEIVEPKKKG